MKATGQYLNSPVRNCQTCTHFVRRKYHDDGICGRFATSAERAVYYDHFCGRELEHWKAKTPRRSLRQWLRDVVWG